MSDINAINQGITAGDDGVLEQLRELEDVCLADETLTTPMAAAVRAGNLSALDVLLGHKAALEYVPKLGDADRKYVRGRAAYDDTGTLEEREAGFSQRMAVAHWERTPLLEACRIGNLPVIEKLLAAGAKLNARDIFGLDAPTLCLERGPEVLQQFMETCSGLGRKFPVRYDLLAELAPHDELYATALSRGSLSKDAKQLAFILSCALLDEVTMRDMLAGGYALEDPVEEYALENPLVQVATSSLLHDIGHPSAASLARGEVRGAARTCLKMIGWPR